MILVTGATGLNGRATTGEFAREGQPVTVYADESGSCHAAGVAASFVECVGRLDTRGNSPRYRRLEILLRHAIERGVLSPGEGLPPERDLALAYGVSRTTVRKALDGLVGALLLTRRQGSGTFVAAPAEVGSGAAASKAAGTPPRASGSQTEWLAWSEGVVGPDEAMALGLGPAAAVWRFAQLRFADGLPLALEHSTIPSACIRTLLEVGRSFHAAMGADRPVRMLERFRAVLLSDAHADLLQCCHGSPGLEVERRGFAQSGLAVEFTRCWYRADAYDFVAERHIGSC